MSSAHAPCPRPGDRGTRSDATRPRPPVSITRPRDKDRRQKAFLRKALAPLTRGGVNEAGRGSERLRRPPPPFPPVRNREGGIPPIRARESSPRARQNVRRPRR